MSCEPWPGRYALACGDLALFVGDAYDKGRPQTVIHLRSEPEGQGVAIGNRFLAFAEDGRFRFTLVHQPRIYEADE